MRKEFVEYMPNIPINVSLVNILGYPLHWHDSIEILFVLKGSISVTIEHETFIVEEKEIEIININEVHSIKSKDKDNRVLIFEIDPKFLAKYYSDIDNVFFYTNSSEEGAQEKEEYYALREYLSELLCEITEKNDDYEDIVRESLLELLSHLINNFHYLFYDEESLKGDEVQLERYHRIAKYIINNYMEKVSLQDIAKKEFLSTQYLSYKIKNNFGHSFNDFLNLIRVEESTKLLLDTEMNISEISEEVGFSHVRYYNKHFKKHYKSTPMQYRKKHEASDEKLEKMKKFNSFQLKDGLNIVSQYLEGYKRFNYENRIETINVDLSECEDNMEFKNIDIIDLGHASNLLIEDNKLIIDNIQKDIGFKYGLVSNLFSEDMDIYIDINSDFINWRSIEKVLDFIQQVELIPMIALANIDDLENLRKIIGKFIDHFSNRCSTDKISEWRYQFSENIDIEPVISGLLEPEQAISLGFVNDELKYNHIYDTCRMVPYIIHSCIFDEKVISLKAFDTLHKGIKLDNELFFGGKGMVTVNGINKPSYYGCYFLSRLGKNIIKKGEGFIITEEDENIQILLYNLNEDSDIYNSTNRAHKNRGGKATIKKRFSINMTKIPNDYNIVGYEISEKHGSSYGYWVSMGKPKRLKDRETDLLKRISFPRTTFGTLMKSTFSNIVITVNENGAVLLELKKVLNSHV